MHTAKKSTLKKYCQRNLGVRKGAFGADEIRLACEYYGDNNLKQKDIGPTKPIKFEDIAKRHNLNIMLY